MKKVKDPVLEKKLLHLRKRSAVIRLIVNAVIAVCCALDYVGERSAFLNVVHGGGITDLILTIVLLDTLFVLGWLASERLMKLHFGLLVICLVILLMSAFTGIFSIILMIWLIFSLLVLLPFIICLISSARVIKAHEKIQEDC